MTRFLFYLVFFSSISTGHASGDILFIAKDTNSSEREDLIIERFSSQLSDSFNEKRLRYIQPHEAGMLSGNNNVVIALGEVSLSEVLQGGGDSPVIAVFISRSSYEAVLATTATTHPVTAIYSDPSPRRQVALIKSLLGDSASVGVLSSPHTHETVKDVVNAAEFLGVKVRVVSLNERQTPKTILGALSDIRTLLLQKDRDIFRVIPLDRLLVLAYDINNIGIVGYSSGVVKNGALATTYTSLSDTVKSVASLVARMIESNTVPKAGYSDYFSVSVNKYVVRSLEFNEKDITALKLDINMLLKGE